MNADIAKGLVEACAKRCPDAIIAFLNPVNSIVPAMAELYKTKGLDPMKIVGVPTLGVCDSYPVFSQHKTAVVLDKENIADLDNRLQDAGTEVVNAILAGLAGRRRVEGAYVKSDVADLPYLTSKVVLAKEGAPLET